MTEKKSELEVAKA
ncbi:unnamed protein product [Linum tenue]|uniref:Uncharacterized protein n=1 Tax=Linum tenue TaxID=586396 RepID=A0AAV0N0R1_9ROSI|nr:unnamed protein product [Linum tenue]